MNKIESKLEIQDILNELEENIISNLKKALNMQLLFIVVIGFFMTLSKIIDKF